MRRATHLVRLLLLSCLVSRPLLAGEVVPFIESGRVGAHIRDLQFPATLRKELTSGLTNRLLVRMTVLAENRSPLQRAIELTVKYDLWDENFRVTLVVDQRAVRDEILPTLDRVLAFLHDARLPGLFAATEVPASASLTLNADVLLNPIEKERMERIREWVAENSTQSPVDPTIPDSSPPVGARMSNALFNRIFEQYASGSQVAAAWHETVVSKPFKLEGLRHD